MNVNNDSKTICKSVFKNGENTISRSQFTKKWIELINRLEQIRKQCFCSMLWNMGGMFTTFTAMNML